MKVWGGWQVETDQPLTVSQIYEMRNGRSYVVDCPLYTPHKACSDVLAENPDFSEFFEILKACEAISTSTPVLGSGSSSIPASFSVSRRGNLVNIPEGSKKVNYLVNNYHYTLYAPTNKAMQKAYEMGLPTLAMLEEAVQIDGSDEEPWAEKEDSAAHIKKVMLDFVKYHIQDNSLFIDEGFESGNYETAKTNPEVLRAYKIAVTNDGSNMTVQGVANVHPQSVNKSALYNAMARETWVVGNTTAQATVDQATTIDVSSFIVVHAIDEPLLFKYKEGSTTAKDNQFIYSETELWEEEEAKQRK